MSKIVKDKTVHISYKVYKSKRSKLDDKKNKVIVTKAIKFIKPKGVKIVIKRLVKLLIGVGYSNEESRKLVLNSIFGISAFENLETSLKGVLPLEEEVIISKLKKLGLNEKQISENYLPFKWDIIVFVKRVNE